MKRYRRGLKYYFSILYVVIWQLLRVGAAGLLLMYYVPALFILFSAQYISYEDIERYENYQPSNPYVTCGMISGTVIEVPRKYIMFWPEYEGKSSWDKDSVFNKKGCDANLVSLGLTVSLPGFNVVSASDYFMGQSLSPILDIAITPLVRQEGFMRSRLDALTGVLKGEILEQEGGGYDEVLELFFVERRDSVFKDLMNRYYWLKKNDEILIVFECYRTRVSTDFYSCDGSFLLGEIGAFVKIKFPFGELERWQELVWGAKKFILSKVIDKE